MSKSCNRSVSRCPLHVWFGDGRLIATAILGQNVIKSVKTRVQADFLMHIFGNTLSNVSKKSTCGPHYFQIFVFLHLSLGWLGDLKLGAAGTETAPCRFNHCGRYCKYRPDLKTLPVSGYCMESHTVSLNSTSNACTACVWTLYSILVLFVGTMWARVLLHACCAWL